MIVNTIKILQTPKNQTSDILQERPIFSPSDLDNLPLEVAPAVNVIQYRFLHNFHML